MCLRRIATALLLVSATLLTASPAHATRSQLTGLLNRILQTMAQSTDFDKLSLEDQQVVLKDVLVFELSSDDEVGKVPYQQLLKVVSDTRIDLGSSSGEIAASLYQTAARLGSGTRRDFESRVNRVYGHLPPPPLSTASRAVSEFFTPAQPRPDKLPSVSKGSASSGQGPGPGHKGFPGSESNNRRPSRPLGWGSWTDAWGPGFNLETIIQHTIQDRSFEARVSGA